MDTPKKQMIMSKLRGRMRLIALGAVVLYSLITILGQQPIISEQQSIQNQLTAEVEELQQTKNFLMSEKDFIGTDAYVEQVAREKLGWVKADEIIFKEVEDEAEASVQPEKEDNSDDEDSKTEEP